MKLKHLYLLLTVLSGIALIYQLALFTQAHDNDMVLLFTQGFASRGAAFLSTDLLAVAIVAAIFIIGEGRRIKMKHLWLPIASIFMLGIGVALPLFLYMREVALKK